MALESNGPRESTQKNHLYPSKNLHILQHRGSTSLQCLQVLNVGQNQIAGKLELSGLPSLGAVIANNNAIAGLKGTSKYLLPPLEFKEPLTANLGLPLLQNACLTTLRSSARHSGGCVHLP